MKTFSAKPAEVTKKWVLIDAKGVVVGDRVAVQSAKSIEAVMLYLATLKVGAVFLPLNTAYTRAEIDYFIGDAQPSLFVTDAVALAAEHRLGHLLVLDEAQPPAAPGEHVADELLEVACGRLEGLRERLLDLPVGLPDQRAQLAQRLFPRAAAEVKAARDNLPALAAAAQDGVVGHVRGELAALEDEAIRAVKLGLRRTFLGRKRRR